MLDERSLYINQILNHCRRPDIADAEYYTVCYTYNGRQPLYRVISYNQGLDIVSNYIKQLQDKVEEYEYIERIIQAAKEKSTK